MTTANELVKRAADLRKIIDATLLAPNPTTASSLELRPESPFLISGHQMYGCDDGTKHRIAGVEIG